MNLQWYPGHMAKTRRMIEDNLKLIDVVVEIVDARIPLSGRNSSFNDIIRRKPRLIVMNKADLADERKTQSWVRYYAERGIKVLPISCSTGAGVNRVIPEAQALVHDKLERAAEKGRNITLKLMMIGAPNVGKSTLINRLAGRASTKTGDRPGVTKGKQWIRIKGGAELLDTPGLLPPKFEDMKAAERLAYTGSIKDEIMNTEELACGLLEYLKEEYPEETAARFKLDIDAVKATTAGWELLELIGRKRGFIISSGEIDYERAANVLLNEFRAAKIGRITLETPTAE